MLSYGSHKRTTFVTWHALLFRDTVGPISHSLLHAVDLALTSLLEYALFRIRAGLKVNTPDATSPWAPIISITPHLPSPSTYIPYGPLKPVLGEYASSDTSIRLASSYLQSWTQHAPNLISTLHSSTTTGTSTATCIQTCVPVEQISHHPT